MMKEHRRTDIDDFAEITEQLFMDGNECPSAEDIANHYCTDKVVIPPGPLATSFKHSVSRRVKDRLPKIRKRLEDKGHQCLLIIQKHYELAFPQTETEAYQHLPGGPNKGIGIYFSTRMDDILLAAHLQKSGIHSAGHARGTLSRVINSVKSGHVDEQRASLTVKDFDQQSLPKNNAEEVKRLRELPPASS